MELREIKEGKARILVPEAERIYDAPVFYNPVMALNRDVSVLAVRVLRVGNALDALSATGIRGIRYALESQVEEVWLNDINPDAFELIIRNVSLNFGLSPERSEKRALFKGLRELVVTNLDANLLMDENFRHFEFVDLDPFGTPLPFIDASLRAVRRKGYLAVTATDTGVLCGAYKSACIRKYNALPLRGELCHETGLRILLGTIARYIGKYDMGFEVLLAYYRDHYFRAFLRLKDGAKAGDGTVEKLGYVYFDQKTGRFEVEKGLLPSRGKAHGPMWLGELKDDSFVEALLEEAEKSELAEKKKALKFLSILNGELDIPLFYELSMIAKRNGLEVRKPDHVVESLREGGFNASRTHFSPTGIKTDAPLEGVVGVLRALQ
ncbi:tRNA (guanine(10)-N(2))-dimethyltransferase [Palaeococcus ferrophilus]|uniref:tRNA (guanine(10)-N(2))-dimethyltransferase n=1 Tax=Palaeococcus ferrophilus TaxID=83868 RepID=UPI00064F4BED|nr:tRNA (guanine(10)-N(2))-dimethyltransferase [Palaeococcus ferrophilus]